MDYTNKQIITHKHVRCLY